MAPDGKAISRPIRICKNPEPEVSTPFSRRQHKNGRAVGKMVISQSNIDDTCSSTGSALLLSKNPSGPQIQRTSISPPRKSLEVVIWDFKSSICLPCCEKLTLRIHRVPYQRKICLKSSVLRTDTAQYRGPQIDLRLERPCTGNSVSACLPCGNFQNFCFVREVRCFVFTHSNAQLKEQKKESVR